MKRLRRNKAVVRSFLPVFEQPTIERILCGQHRLFQDSIVPIHPHLPVHVA